MKKHKWVKLWSVGGVYLKVGVSLHCGCPSCVQERKRKKIYLCEITWNTKAQAEKVAQKLRKTLKEGAD
jgi:hypothetical protein